jgi:predicted ATPase
MIDGFSIAGYRSFGPKPVEIRDLSRLNIFIRKNNCGKSNILRFLKLIADALRQERSGGPDQILDHCLDTERGIDDLVHRYSLLWL